MPKAADLLRHLGALGIGLLGTLGVFALSVGMNAQTESAILEPVAAITTLPPASVPPRKGPERPERSSPVRKARAAAPAASPLLAGSLAGLDFGLPSGADAAFADATLALVGDLGGAVLDEASVDDPPVPTTRTPPRFPPRARALGQAGHVTVSFVVDVDGSVQDVSVVESEPGGVFDEAALTAVRTWRFEAGRDEGTPVAVRVRQTLSFELE